MWQGECVHDAIAEFLTRYQEGNDVQFDRLALNLQQRMTRDWNFSEKRQFREEPALIGRFGAALFEHETNEVPPETLLTELVRERGRCYGPLTNGLYNYPTFFLDFIMAKRRCIRTSPGDTPPRVLWWERCGW